MEDLTRQLSELSHDLQDCAKEVHTMKSQIEGLKATIDKLVTRHEFDPIRLLVYGMCGSVLAGALGALLSKVLVK